MFRRAPTLLSRVVMTRVSMHRPEGYLGLSAKHTSRPRSALVIPTIVTTSDDSERYSRSLLGRHERRRFGLQSPHLAHPTKKASAFQPRPKSHHSQASLPRPAPPLTRGEPRPSLPLDRRWRLRGYVVNDAVDFGHRFDDALADRVEEAVWEMGGFGGHAVGGVDCA